MKTAIVLVVIGLAILPMAIAGCNHFWDEETSGSGLFSNLLVLGSTLSIMFIGVALMLIGFAIISIRPRQAIIVFRKTDLGDGGFGGVAVVIEVTFQRRRFGSGGQDSRI